VAVSALPGLTAASASCGVVLLLVLGDARAVLLGTIGPLLAALVTWVAVERTHAREPSRVSGVMIVLFGVKMVSYPAYVVAVVLLLEAGSTAFVVSFTCQIVLLYGVEALYLRRLFAGAR
jgi:hypothetical protein